MKTIAITLGDVSGIGPEVVQKALRSRRLDRRFRYEVVLKKEAPRLAPGRSSRAAAFFAWTSLESAVQGCLSGEYAAMVTGPVCKASLKDLGFRFPGQTEWLAHRTRARKHAMMLAGEGLRVSLVTIHDPIRKVSRLLSQKKILDVIHLTHDWLARYITRHPRILVAALNPHGGVGDEAGDEERKIIQPAILAARKSLGKRVEGPFSPDQVFWKALNEKADAVVCMYHDQGLIPLKTFAFHSGVNITLGLPIIRTSPDHGTAFDIAGKNRANPGSMISAINLAARLAKA